MMPVQCMIGFFLFYSRCLVFQRMKETADSTVPSSDLGAFERAASANDVTDTTKEFTIEYHRRKWDF